MTAEKLYVVEIETVRGERHLLQVRITPLPPLMNRAPSSSLAMLLARIPGLDSQGRCPPLSLTHFVARSILLQFKLVYDWLLYCHLVASCTILSGETSRFFPGGGEEEDSSGLMDI